MPDLRDFVGIEEYRDKAMRTDDPRHGTYAGANQHRRDGELPCRPCQDAQNAYMAAYRDKRGHDYQRAYNKARARAIGRLITKYRAEFRRIFAEERKTK